MDDNDIKIYVCYEFDFRECANRLDGWVHTNVDKEVYSRRADVDVNSEAAESIKKVLRYQIQEAQVTVCIISQTTCIDDWIEWELEASKSGPKRNGLVGILLHEKAVYPPAMTDSGAMFVPFKKDAVEYAITWALTDHDHTVDFTLDID